MTVEQPTPEFPKGEVLLRKLRAASPAPGWILLDESNVATVSVGGASIGLTPEPHPRAGIRTEGREVTEPQSGVHGRAFVYGRPGPVPPVSGLIVKIYPKGTELAIPADVETYSTDLEEIHVRSYGPGAPDPRAFMEGLAE